MHAKLLVIAHICCFKTIISKIKNLSMLQNTKYLLLGILIIHQFKISAQVADVTELDSAFLNWHNADYHELGIVGTSVDKAYRELLKDKKPKKTIVVAVIDSGIDILHEDLQGKIWVNEDEIPDNNIDDDNNGYIDDVNGWNFIGAKDGRNVNHENLEFVRIVRKGDENDPNYARAKKMYEAQLAEKNTEEENLAKFQEIYVMVKMIIKEKTGVTVSSKEDLDKIETKDPQTLKAKEFLVERYESGFTEESLMEYSKYINEYLNYYLNINFTPRTIIGDDPEDISDRDYGNNNVIGPRANHGTGVAGLIAAVRDNGIGINGVATDVKIMTIRNTPDGDERDKDVALGIMYAVDNGADIINMSFGKDFSPQKEFVDMAVKYAEEKGVLLIHAAGNDGVNIDEAENYPNDLMLDGSTVSNWLTVGANAKDLNREVAAVFTNYGKSSVDILSPGVDVISTDTLNTYSMHDGTSFSAPIASGIAALVLSYYPDLTPAELISILKDSSYKFRKPKKVLIPNDEGGKRKKIKFKDLSQSGGIINAYAALAAAEKLSNQ